MFPQEQGITFSGQEQSQYLAMANVSSDPTGELTTIENSSKEGFDQWDVTQGFMGSNSIKQSTKSGITGYSNNIFSNIKIMATQLFGANSPVLWVINILLVLTTSYLVYLTIKFIRTGN
jgi:hypothetical protein